MNIQAHASTLVPDDVASSLLWLLGQPHLEEYLSFVARKVIGGADIAPLTLADEWRAANDLFYELEQTEAGEPDHISVTPLPAELAQLADQLRADSFYRTTFDALPTSIEMVELDRLIMWQGQISDRFALRRGETLGHSPTPEALFRFCFPLERVVPPVTIRRLAEDRYQFISDVTDFSAHSPQLLATTNLAGLATTGPIAAALTIPLGVDANFLSAIRSDNRLLLHNGYHRAYALRAMGITHAPCIIQTVTRRDELKYAADPRVSSDPAFYFRAARPPMLRDFFNPRLTKHLRIRPIQTVVEVQVQVTSWSSTELCPDDLP